MKEANHPIIGFNQRYPGQYGNWVAASRLQSIDSVFLCKIGEYRSMIRWMKDEKWLRKWSWKWKARREAKLEALL